MRISVLQFSSALCLRKEYQVPRKDFWIISRTGLTLLSLCTVSPQLTPVPRISFIRLESPPKCPSMPVWPDSSDSTCTTQQRTQKLNPISVKWQPLIVGGWPAFQLVQLTATNQHRKKGVNGYKRGRWQQHVSKFCKSFQRKRKLKKERNTVNIYPCTVIFSMNFFPSNCHSV